MIIANLVRIWEPFRAVQVRLLALMKNVLTVITSPAVSLAMIGTPPPKPAPRNAQVLINILVPVQTKPAEAARLATDYMRLVLAPADIAGKMELVKLLEQHGDNAVAMQLSVHLDIYCLAMEHVVQMWYQEKHR